jgi:hypothetical protein
MVGRAVRVNKSISLPAPLAAQLATEAEGHAVTESAIVEDALETHFQNLNQVAWARIGARAERGKLAKKAGGKKGRDARHGRPAARGEGSGPDREGGAA